MKTVDVNTNTPYRILIGKGLLPDTGELIREVKKPCRIALVTDDIVDGLYSSTVEDSLERAGYSVCKYVFPNGEASKNATVYIDILEFLAREQLTRSDLLVALGGGVTGDMAGFAAATYLRGIPFVQIPTTFLAAIDSSVGGKTGIDLQSGKNLAGAFWQPSLVICDHGTLSTLPEEVFADGSAEAVKYGILSSPELFGIFESGDVKEKLPEIIEECVSIKRDVVLTDEFDHGTRQLLNLGHTIGHGVEKLSHFTVTHGHAVSIGTVIAAGIARHLGLCSPEVPERIRRTLLRQGLPVTSPYGPEELAQVALSDKKRRGDEITLILPESIGSCRLYPVPVSRLSELIAYGMEEEGRG